jgi:hypothetical protein
MPNCFKQSSLNKTNDSVILYAVIEDTFSFFWSFGFDGMSENFTLIQDRHLISSMITFCYLPIHNFCPDNQLYRRMSHQNHSTLSVILYLYRPVAMRLMQHIIFFQH